MSTLLNISKIETWFSQPLRRLYRTKNVDLQIKKGEFISLIGHSGCGKSTVLNVVAGLYQATKGGVLLNNKEVTEPGPERRLCSKTIRYYLG